MDRIDLGTAALVGVTEGREKLVIHVTSEDRNTSVRFELQEIHYDLLESVFRKHKSKNITGIAKMEDMLPHTKKSERLDITDKLDREGKTTIVLKVGDDIVEHTLSADDIKKIKDFI